jgi:hypothetical protein
MTRESDLPHNAEIFVYPKASSGSTEPGKFSTTATLAKHWSYCELSHYEELHRAFGQRITSIVPFSTGKKMRVGFTLEDGEQLVFDASDKPLPAPDPPARRPRRPGR